MKTEKDKYTRIWNLPEYRKNSPGVRDIGYFLNLFYFSSDCKSVIDLGCGAGRAGIIFHKLGYRVMMLDIAANCLDEGIREYVESHAHIDFIEGSIIEALNLKADLAYCADVLEHIPENQIMDSLRAIKKMVKVGMFVSVSTIPDHLGDKIGETLHMTVKGKGWWYDRFAESGWSPSRFKGLRGRFMCMLRHKP